MSDYQPKPNTGVLFQNSGNSDKSPDLKGNIILPDGRKMNIAAWEKEDKNGNTYYSLKLSEIIQ